MKPHTQIVSSGVKDKRDAVIPSDPVTLLIITWKGPAAAILLVGIGNTLSSIVEFNIGRSISDLADFEKQK